MIETKQTILHDPDHGKHGNCMSAVIASLLHIPIDSVPLFINPDSWIIDLNKWLRPYGLAYLPIDNLPTHLRAFGIHGLWHDVAGNTTRSTDVLHACVGLDGEVVFDPHPDNSGLINADYHGVFIALEPWKMVGAK